MNLKMLRLTEIVVWLLIIFIGGFVFVYNTEIKNQHKNTYYVFLDDAAGLVPGSVVRLMGLNIGYIKTVKIFENKVFVSMKVTKENVEIPKCATATIEFYGLGGSVSLELSPVTSSHTDNTTQEIIPSKSYRIQDYYNGSKLDSEVLIDYYGRLGRRTTNEDILRFKPYVFQSKLLRKLNEQTEKINEEQTVIIRKLEKNVVIPETNDNNEGEIENAG